MRRAILVMVAVTVALGASVSTQQRVITRMEPFDYDVVPNWSLPYPKAGYTWGSVPGVFVESDDRIFVVSRGEIPIPNPVPEGFQGFSDHSAVPLARPRTRSAGASVSSTAPARCSRCGRSGTSSFNPPTVLTR